MHKEKVIKIKALTTIQTIDKHPKYLQKYTSILLPLLNAEEDRHRNADNK